MMTDWITSSVAYYIEILGHLLGFSLNKNNFTSNSPHGSIWNQNPLGVLQPLVLIYVLCIHCLQNCRQCSIHLTRVLSFQKIMFFAYFVVYDGVSSWLPLDSSNFETHWCLGKMSAILQTTFPNPFSCILFQISNWPQWIMWQLSNRIQVWVERSISIEVDII